MSPRYVRGLAPLHELAHASLYGSFYFQKGNHPGTTGGPLNRPVTILIIVASIGHILTFNQTVMVVTITSKVL